MGLLWQKLHKFFLIYFGAKLQEFKQDFSVHFERGWIGWCANQDILKYADMKKKLTVFVSYARANRDLATRFLKKFKEQASPSKQYSYEFWRDNDILVGEKWHEEIQVALDQCDAGLVLISPAFLGSQYIQDHELPKFLKGGGRPVIPVLLQPIDLERHDLKGLQRTQIFRLDRPRFASPKAYGECSGTQRDQFALELFRQVEARLDKVMFR